jgi:uncharacterized protein
MNERTRHLPDIALPRYSYVPGHFPHPFSSSAGHRFGHDLQAATQPDPERWRESLHYLLGIDLFNHGFYWEAHEAWESLWHVCGRRGQLATFFKALIHLAAAGVKAREPRLEGVLSHARRAKELLEELGVARFMGMEIATLIAHVDTILAPPPIHATPSAAVEVVFAFELSVM